MDFGYKLVDGAPSALYIFDHTQSQETNVHLPVLGGANLDNESWLADSEPASTPRIGAGRKQSSTSMGTMSTITS
jgi:hypothetical protein